MEDAASRPSPRSITPWEARVARVSNGAVRVGDWVAELPASHFQPCACCLCRPPAGAQPVFRIRAIESDGGRTYLRFGREHRHLADEFERVEPPDNAIDPVVIASDPAANAGLLRYHLSRFLAEHRSALNGQVVELQGVVVFALVGDDACPTSSTRCAEPRIILAETPDPERDRNYDVLVLVRPYDVPVRTRPEDTQYQVRDQVQVRGIVQASKVTVLLRNVR